MKSRFLLSRTLFALFFLAAFVGGSPAFAQGENDIAGTWLTDNGKAKFHIFKTTAGTFAGKLVWMRSPNDKDGNPKTDPKNPNKALRSRPLQDAVLLTGLKWDAEEQEYKGGKVYDPTSGKIYNCFAKIEDSNLKLRGYVGISLLGKTTVWKRTTD